MKRKLFISILTALAVVSCTKQNSDIVPDDDRTFCQMSFSASGSSVKAVHIGGNRVFWQNNDAISICSRIAERNVGLKFSTELDAPAASAVFTGSAPVLESYSAVYPYSAVDHWQSNGNPVVYVVVPTSQKAVIGSFDPTAAVLAATTSDSNFTFSHVCSYLKFTVGPDSPEIVSVTVSTVGESVAGTCYVDMTSEIPVFGRESLKNTSVSISNGDETVLQEGDYYITMFPLKYSNGLTLSVLCADGSKIVKSIDKEVQMLSGKVYEAGTISSEGGKTPFKLLDVYMEEGVAKGVVFYVSDDGMTAKIVSLDRTETVAWSTVGAATLGSSSTSDGSANTLTLRASAEAASIPALAFCDSHGEGWYWPALNELQALFETYNGTTYSSATKAVPANITEAEKASRAAFEKVLADNGGTALNTAAETENGTDYWSSTEQIASGVAYGSSFRFGKPYASGAGDQLKKTNATKRYVRCIKVVTK